MITTPAQQATQRTRTQTMMPLLALCLGYFMTILDVTIVNIALVDIKEHLSANVTGLQWIVDGYALVFASLLLTGGALGDRRGSRTIFLIGFALFTLAATLCSLAGFQATRRFCLSKRGHFLNDFDKEQHSVVSEAQGSGTI
jgi:DHA2 family methylenomycin A resistance protein-like MFS transporter